MTDKHRVYGGLECNGGIHHVVVRVRCINAIFVWIKPRNNVCYLFGHKKKHLGWCGQGFRAVMNLMENLVNHPPQNTACLSPLPGTLNPRPA